jgi:hypothetical protein
MTPAVWISLLEVQGGPGSELAGECAYVNSVTVAHSRVEAEEQFRVSARSLGLDVLSFEDTELFEQRCLQFEVDPEVKELAELAWKTGSTQFGTFHAWEDDS